MNLQTTNGTPRLLPWTTDDGRACYLLGGGNGRVSRVADNVESTQLATAAELLDRATELLSDRRATPPQLHLLAARLTKSLRDVHRVAESRGARLPDPDDDSPDSED